MKRVFLHCILFTIFFLLSKAAACQVIVPFPIYPTDSDSCLVIFDATLGNGELLNVSPPIYAHTGVITNLSTSPGDWKYTVAPWNLNLSKALMTPLGNNKYQINLKPSIRAFYGVPASEQIKKIAFVFRNTDGSKSGRNADGSDIFIDVYPDMLSVNIVLPTSKVLFLKQNDPIPVSAISPGADTMKIFVNNNLVKTTAGINITDTILANNFGQNWVKHWVMIMAKNGTGIVADSFYYTTLPPAHIAALPAGMNDGINYIDSITALLCLFAPEKNNVFVIGDFNDWNVDSNYYMNITPDGSHYWIQLNNLVPKQEYIFQYFVDGNLYIGDPYADKVSDPDDQYIPAETYPGLKPYPTGKANGVATFLQTGQDPYPWNIAGFTPPQVTNLVIYELLIRDFTTKHDYPSLIDTLDYLKHLGINAIELMPVMEFEGNISWGYNPDYSFAVDKYYGTKDGLKQFIEAAHSKGIAVILDIVLNHQFGESPLVRLYWDAANNRPSASSPWFNPIPKHPYNVGYDFNHETPFTQSFCKRFLGYWLSEYHVDGFRFDMSKGFTQRNSYPNNVSLWGQYDAGRITRLESYQDHIRSIKPDAIMIMEHFADNDEETVLSSDGMLLWGNMNGKYNEATMGWNNSGNSDLSWISYQQRSWADPHVVGYMESHDEERLAYKNITFGNSSGPYYNVRDTSTSLSRLELAATFFYTVPGPKMLWQFGELGYDYSINYPTGTSDSRLAPKPIRWDYLGEWRRWYTKNIVAALIDLKKTQPVFATTDYSIDLTAAVKRIWLHHTTMDATVLGNFDVADQNVVPGFTRTGMWYEFFTGDSLNVADAAASLAFKAGEYRIYTTVRLPKPLFTGLDENMLPKMLNGSHVKVYPNPSDGLFNFIVNLPQPSSIEVTVYNMFGNLVYRLIPKHLSQGINTFIVNLLESNEKKPRSGIYLFRLDAGIIHESGKLIVK